MIASAGGSVLGPGETMRRREFIALVGASITWPFAARAQQAMPTVGVMSTASPMTTTFGVLFPKLMKEFGWEENLYWMMTA